MTRLAVRAALFGATAMLFSAFAVAQPPSSQSGAQPPPAAPETVQPQAASPQAALPPPQHAPSNGVLHPPADVDPGMKVSPGQTAKMPTPVIHPPVQNDGTVVVPK